MSSAHSATLPASSGPALDAATNARFRDWQNRTLLATMGGYAAFYFVRKNLSVGTPAMGEDLGISKADLGLFLTPHGLLYGVSKFANGYTLRYAVLDWGPTLLKEWKGVPLSHAGWMVAAFEVSGMVGMLAAGWATDRLFGGRAARMCVVCMTLAACALVPFWLLPSPPAGVWALLLGAAGFFIYGPQALVGIAAANLATRRAAATVVGFTGLFGYLSTILSGWGLGLVAESFGWGPAFGALMGIAALSILTFALAWPARAHGYGRDESAA